MKLKKFIAPDMRAALKDVRETFGSEAVILNDRAIPGGIEVTAAIDYDQSLWQAPDVQTEKTSTLASVSPASTKTSDQVQWLTDPKVDAMQQEITAMRDLLQQQLASLSWQRQTTIEPGKMKLLKDLAQLGLTPYICRQIAANLSMDLNEEQNWQAALKTLGSLINTPEKAVTDLEGAVALIGPTGVGKTTTIAKLAARYVIRHGANSLGLITTDTFRIGAHEQLQTYGNLLGVPVRSVETQTELTRVMQQMQNKRLILIDTIGLSQRDKNLPARLSMLTESGFNIKKLLVLSANAHPLVLDRTIDAFGNKIVDPIMGAIITKLDECMNLGELLSLLIKHHLPIAYASDGQRVPEDLKIARRDDLIATLQYIAEHYMPPLSNAALAHTFAFEEPVCQTSH